MTASASTASTSHRTRALSGVLRAPLSKAAWLVGAAVVLGHLATARLYSYHRDEPYYLASGRRLAWGYVDHPPITPLLYRVGDALFGDSLLGLRVIPALLHGCLVILTVLIAREFGADARAQLVAALAGALVPIALTTGHFLGTVTPELVAWSAASLLLVRLLNSGDPKLWLAFGAVIGLGFMDKWTTAYLVVGLAVGVVATPQRHILATPWLLAGMAIAMTIWMPNLVWHAQHGWTQFEVARGLRNYTEALLTLPFLVAILGSASIILAVPGLVWLARNPAAQPYRALVIAFAVIVVMVMATGGKPYYAAVFGPVLLAAGAVAIAPASTTIIAVLVASSLAIAPFAMPLLPVGAADSVAEANPEIREMLGWPQLVDTVEKVYDEHPGATIFTSNYSEAGIIELLGRDRGLPQPISGHMTYWYWGHPSGRSQDTIAVGFTRRQLQRYWSDVELVARFQAPHGIDNKENGAPIWVCRDQKTDWDTLWPKARRFTSAIQ